MRVDVGPMAAAGAVAWIDWARSATDLPRDVVDDVGRCLEGLTPRSVTRDESPRCNADIDPDELEYVIFSCHALDAKLSGNRSAGCEGMPAEGRTSYLVLVRALLHALEGVSPVRAAFVDQLRSSWPGAAELR